MKTPESPLMRNIAEFIESYREASGERKRELEDNLLRFKERLCKSINNR